MGSVLPAGSKLGPYEILGPVGSGGMGEVYRANDTRLDRTVAIKVLPSHLSSNPDFRRRFEREARAVSSLNHPNICTLHDIGHFNGTDYLVMEFIEGETLASRLLKGPLPTEQVLRYAIQIADALDQAHRHGIVHRDLKPGNIMLTKSGAKVLDFGLATNAAPSASSAQSDLLTRSSPLTAEGIIVGTLQYMAPEQLEGKPTDARTDIFAFGTLVYEIATGKKAFEGTSQASLIAAILEKHPTPILQIQPLSPPILERIVETCLAKDPEDRWQSMHDVSTELKWISDSAPRVQTAVSLERRMTHKKWLVWPVAVLLAAGLIYLGYVLHRPQFLPLLRSSIVLPPGLELDANNRCLALSPDGKRLAFAARGTDGIQRLWIRFLEESVAQPLAGTEGATYPFWSPDNQWIGYFANRKLNKIPASGGAIQALCEAIEGRGASWGAQGSIVFAPYSTGSLWQVSSSGGQRKQVTMAQTGQTHRLPWFLPDGKNVLFFSIDLSPAGTYAMDNKNPEIRVLNLETKGSRLLARENSEGRYMKPGYLAFVRDGNLMVQTFNTDTLTLTGDAILLADRVKFGSYRWAGAFSFSETGMLLFMNAEIARKSRLTWFDLDGKPLGEIAEPDNFWLVDIAPHGNQAVLTIMPPENVADLYLYDLEKETRTRFTFNEDTFFPLYSGDGRQIAYSSGNGRLFLKATDGASDAQEILKDGAPESWSRDGKWIAFRKRSEKTGWDQWILPMTVGRKPFIFLKTNANELAGTFSPDSKWFSYISDESGLKELYVVPFPGPGAKRQISSGGAINGFWLGDGNEIAYVTHDYKLIAVEFFVNGANFQTGKSRPLFGGRPIPFSRPDDMSRGGGVPITRDGKRLLFPVTVQAGAPENVTFVTNWETLVQKK